jgi:predicted lipoprotein with Yx(FWY)xxD motif
MFVTLFWVCTSLVLLTPPAASQDARTVPLGYPGAVALSQEGSNLTYKSFPAFLPLYVFEGDAPGKSNCDAICTAVWPIVKAANDAVPIGDWSVISREDGRRQWAYKNRPVYTFFADESSDPQGVGLEAGWYYNPDANNFTNIRELVATQNRSGKSAWRLLEP